MFVLQWAPSRKLKRQSYEWEKIFENCISNNGLIFKIHKGEDPEESVGEGGRRGDQDGDYL